MSEFVKGIDLCESFFTEIARPILEQDFPSLRYSAGLIGYGSDVLGFDDSISTDHMWGPRFHLFLPPDDFESLRSQITEIFSTRFPYQYKGYSVHFGPPDPQDGGTRLRQEIHSGHVDPLIEYHTPVSFFRDYLDWDSSTEITIPQWLTFTEHRLLGATSGRMFHDDLGIGAIREKLDYYPRDVWLWMMASQWKMLAEEEPYVGRCGLTGDDPGSRIIAVRQVQRLMRLAFMLEKRYAPYSKWFGRAFQQLQLFPMLSPLISQVMDAADWKTRDELLARAYSLMAEQHNNLKLTNPLETRTSYFFNRPFNVIHGDRFTRALLESINDPELRSLPPVGTINQITDSVTLYDDSDLTRRFRCFY